MLTSIQKALAALLLRGQKKNICVENSLFSSQMLHSIFSLSNMIIHAEIKVNI